jgi:hypothetical protein
MASTTLPLFTQNTWTATSSKESAVLLRLPISLLRLLALLDENGEDDYGQIGPSQFAFRTAFYMIAHATAILDEDIPCIPVVDAEGGIRVTWNRFGKQIKLICPSTKEGLAYIYQSSPSGNSLRDQNVSSALLADRLSWLTRREPSAAAAD